ncbi:MAG: hypothetical protein GX575_18050 [Candidatus Anammoximicrobium sp.]|nr:hypothetical protein [Candidatus Anammoximicrobium sp.]
MLVVPGTDVEVSGAYVEFYRFQRRLELGADQGRLSEFNQLSRMTS